MTKQYLVLHCCDAADGVSLHMFSSEDELIEFLNGDVMADGDLRDDMSYQFLTKPASLDTWPSERIFIFHGNVVIPKPKDVVKTWQL